MDARMNIIIRYFSMHKAFKPSNLFSQNIWKLLSKQTFKDCLDKLEFLVKSIFEISYLYIFQS